MMRLTYMSKPSLLMLSPLFESSVRDIHDQAIANNRRNGLTGALVVHENWFMQVVEGEQRPLGDLMMKLLVDPRHHDMQIFEMATVRERHFQNWAMHYSTLDKLDPQLVHGCIENFNRRSAAAPQLLLETLMTSVPRAA